ncbi:3-oxoadipate enol-lactonase [Burkholderia multivorans]
MAFYRSHDRENYFVEFGAGKPIVLLHGIGNSGRAWGPQIAPLVQSGYRVIVPDLVGHGASSRIDKPYGVAEFACDVVALLDHLAIESADMVGLSLGGIVALELALTSPVRVQRLVLANSFATTATDAFQGAAQQWAHTFRCEHGPVLRFETAWPLNLSESFRNSEAGIRTWQVWHGIAATVDGPSLAHVTEGVMGYDVSTRLASIDKRALVIAGSDDSISPPAISRAIAADLAHARFHEIAGAAHISNVDSSDAFNDALLGFLSEQ